MTTGFFKKAAKTTAFAVAAIICGSCAGPIASADRSASYLVVEIVQGTSGASLAAQFESTLNSDVQTIVTRTINGQQTRIPTTFSDPGRVQLRMALKQPGPGDAPTEPSVLNWITVDRFRVEYIRTDGRNTPGVDVPYPIEGGATINMGFSSVTLGFELVRLSSKQEAPLVNLIGGGGAGVIATIAKVTFYGRDGHGNPVQASGNISVVFADFADPPGA